jgi:DNA-directed RNA polymerase subunit RPC12/RpoP
MVNNDEHIPLIKEPKYETLICPNCGLQRILVEEKFRAFKDGGKLECLGCDQQAQDDEDYRRSQIHGYKRIKCNCGLTRILTRENEGAYKDGDRLPGCLGCIQEEKDLENYRKELDKLNRGVS